MKCKTNLIITAPYSRSRDVRGQASLLACVWLAALFPASAAVIWPTQWSPVYGSDGGLYADGKHAPPGFTDPNFATPPSPESLDVVGGLDSQGAGPYAGGFWATDDAHIFFRMRVDNMPNQNPQAVWQVLLNTDDDEWVDWVIQLDLSSSDSQVELAKNSAINAGGPSDNWTTVDLSTSAFPHVGAGTPKTDFYRWVNATATDGSNFHALNDDDYFIDMAFPKSIFETETGLAFSNTFGVALSTSANHNNINKDLPDTGWGSIPEPSVVLLSLLASCTALVRRKR